MSHSHTTRQCRLLIQQFREKQPSEKEKESDKDEDKEEDDGYPNVNATLVIFADIERKSRLKVINREVNMVAPATTTYLKWYAWGKSGYPLHLFWCVCGTANQEHHFPLDLSIFLGTHGPLGFPLNFP